MTTKPPPLFRPVEVLKICATPRAFKALVVALGVLLIPPGANTILKPLMPAPGPVPLPVPQMDWTTDAKAGGPVPAILGTLPSPGPNQKRAGTCNPRAAQVEINNGCWVKTETPPPCPEGIQWEHERRCWLPVAHAKPVPQSGGAFPVNVAGEE